MKKEKEIQVDLLKRHSVGVVHMRQQLKEQRMGLVLGIGVSRSVGFRDWTGLIKEISRNKEVQGSKILEQSQAETASTQLLYQKFKDKYLKNPTHRENMTVNYNFDDTIERFLADGKEDRKGSRGYTVIWDQNVQTEKTSYEKSSIN